MPFLLLTIYRIPFQPVPPALPPLPGRNPPENAGGEDRFLRFSMESLLMEERFMKAFGALYAGL